MLWLGVTIVGGLIIASIYKWLLGDGDERVSYTIHTKSGVYRDKDVPKEIGGRPVVWDVRDHHPGGKDVTLIGHYTDEERK